MSINKYRIIRRIKWGIYYAFRFFIRFENIHIPRKNKKIQRLFTSTGSISLINVLTIIYEIENFDKYDDILIIDTGKGEEAFVEKQLEIAKLHKFKKILASPRITPGIQAVLNNLWNVDEIYILNHPLHIGTILPLYPNADVTLFDEGAGSLMDFGCERIKNLKKIKTHKYLNKLDFMGLKDMERYNFEPPNKDTLKYVVNKISEQAPVNIICNPEDKYILYCGIYWEVTGLPREKFIQIQTNMLNELLDAGYKILYKPHPRDNENFGFDKNPNVTFFDSKFPVEIYNLDIVAILSVSSTTPIIYPHFWQVAGFSNILEESLKENPNDITNNNILRGVIDEYSLNYKKLLDYDVKGITKVELKKHIYEDYQDFLNSKPLLSENKNIMDLMEKYGKK